MENKGEGEINSVSIRPLIRSFLLALVLVIAVGFRHIPRLDPDQLFFLQKLEGTSRNDVILLGDSRVFVGLDPSAFTRAIPGSSCLNYGFSALGYSNSYFDQVVNRLSETAPKRLIVLAIDAASLTPQAVHSNAFADVYGMNATERFHIRTFAPIWKATDPIVRPYQFYANGWIPVKGVPFVPSESLSIYSRFFARTKYSEAILSDVARFVKAMSGQGIKVLALRMPTTREMYRIECEAGGYPPEHVRRTLVDAGASWLELPNIDQDSFDGSHLDLQPAQRISKLVAETGARMLHP